MKLSKYSFHLKAKEPIFLPPYKGSTLRGGFGVAFKRVVCAVRNSCCDECILVSRCIYSYIFETRPPADSETLRNYRNIPHPYVIEPPPGEKKEYKSGESIIFNLILIGRAIEYLPYFIYTFEELGRMGIGRGRGRFALSEVRCLTSEDPVCSTGKGSDVIIYNGRERVLKSSGKEKIITENMDNMDGATEAVHLNFLTPTRIVINGNLVVNLQFHQLMSNLLRRLSNLSYFHCGRKMDIDFRGLVDRAKKIETVEDNLGWFDWERYSARQSRRMKLGGFIGSASFEGGLTEFMPYLRVGEVIHVGKGTTFGLGKYKITPVR